MADPRRQAKRWLQRTSLRRPGPRIGRRDLATTIEDCEAYLSGGYLELVMSRHEPIPPWAWLNTLAHGTTPDLVVLASTADLSRMPQVPSELVARMAADMLKVIVRNGIGAEDLQRSVLLPLETVMRTTTALSCPDDECGLITLMACLQEIRRSGLRPPR